MSGFVKNFNIGIYSDAIDAINVTFCMMVLLIELYLSIPLSVTWTIFQGHSSVEQFLLKMLCFIQIRLNFVGLRNKSSK